MEERTDAKQPHHQADKEAESRTHEQGHVVFHSPWHCQKRSGHARGYDAANNRHEHSTEQQRNTTPAVAPHLIDGGFKNHIVRRLFQCFFGGCTQVSTCRCSNRSVCRRPFRAIFRADALLSTFFSSIGRAMQWPSFFVGVKLTKHQLPPCGTNK